MPIDLTDERAAELRQKHGDELKKVRVAGQVFVLRGPSAVEYQRFLDRSIDDKKRMMAVDELTRGCVVFPDAAQADAFFTKKPAAPTALASHVLELAGVTGEDLGNV